MDARSAGSCGSLGVLPSLRPQGPSAARLMKGSPPKRNAMAVPEGSNTDGRFDSVPAGREATTPGRFP